MSDMKFEDSKDKYKMFRNFMANELGISREDIERWTKESVESQVQKIIGRFDLGMLVEKVIAEKLNGYGTHEVREIAGKTLGKLIADRIYLDIRISPETK